MPDCATDNRAGNRMMSRYMPCYGANRGAFETTRRLGLARYNAQQSYRYTNCLLHFIYSRRFFLSVLSAHMRRQ